MSTQLTCLFFCVAVFRVTASVPTGFGQSTTFVQSSSSSSSSAWAVPPPPLPPPPGNMLPHVALFARSELSKFTDDELIQLAEYRLLPTRGVSRPDLLVSLSNPLAYHQRPDPTAAVITERRNQAKVAFLRGASAPVWFWAGFHAQPSRDPVWHSRNREATIKWILDRMFLVEARRPVDGLINAVFDATRHRVQSEMQGASRQACKRNLVTKRHAYVNTTVALALTGTKVGPSFRLGGSRRGDGTLVPRTLAYTNRTSDVQVLWPVDFVVPPLFRNAPDTRYTVPTKWKCPLRVPAWATITFDQVQLHATQLRPAAPPPWRICDAFGAIAADARRPSAVRVYGDVPSTRDRAGSSGPAPVRSGG